MNTLRLTFPILPPSNHEYIQQLKTNIETSEPEKRKILISSSNFDEAKNYVAIELWRALAESGVRTLLIDLDNTSLVLHDKYHVQSVDESEVYETNVTNGDIVPLRNMVDNLILLDRLEDEYERIIVNAPPMDHVGDPDELLSHCDVSILIGKRQEEPILRKSISLEFQELPYSIEEALKRLRTNIKFSGHDTKKILVTSSLPNEGKSFISVELWRMLAESGTKTVFVDLDFRNSVLKDRYTIRSEEMEIKGLDHYLSGQAEYDEVIYNTNIDYGDFVPVSTLLENPSSLFEDKRFAEFLDQLAKEYRYVILDSPPMINVADGGQIATLCDGAVMIVRSGFASRKLIKEALQQLERVECKLLGMVLNREPVPTKGYGRYGYGYGKYGKYGYGKYGYGKYGEYGKKKDKG